MKAIPKPRTAGIEGGKVDHSTLCPCTQSKALHRYQFLQMASGGTALPVQWLGLGVFIARGWDGSQTAPGLCKDPAVRLMYEELASSAVSNPDLTPKLLPAILHCHRS